MPALSPAVIIVDPSSPLLAGNCDVDGCIQRASYSIGNLYLCTDCLIESCAEGKIPVGTIIYRVQQRAFNS